MTTTTRRADIDNLRSAATFLLLVFHTAKVFDYAPFYHVKNAASLQGFDVFTGFLHQWHMPLFFVLAGWSMAAALRRRTPAQIRRERVKRLLVPFGVFFAATCLWIGWMEARHATDRTVADHGSPVQFFGVAVTWSHLWFLVYLFTFSLLWLPTLQKLHQRERDPVVNRGTLFRFMGVMVAIQVVLRWAWPGQQTLVWDWANVAYYSAFFVGGFCVGRFGSVAQLVDDHRVVMGSIGVVAAVCQVPFWTRLVVVDGLADWEGYLVYQTLSALAGVGVVVGILGWARRHLTGDGWFHTWATDRAFGIYLLHQAGVVAIAALVIGTTWPIAVKFALTLLGATAVALGVNEALRRVDFMAPAFGRDRRRDRGNVQACPATSP